MISRKTVRLIAESYQAKFTYKEQASQGNRYQSRVHTKRNEFYDFLFINDFPAWFCNEAKDCIYENSVKLLVMKLHTGESLEKSTPNWSWEERQKLGQRYLKDLAEDYLNSWQAEKGAIRGKESRYAYEQEEKKFAEIQSSLELDGYIYKDCRLLFSEGDVLDVEEEQGILARLFKENQLGKEETAFHHLALSDEHYLAGRWDDSISNSRKFLECILQEIATAHSQRIKGTALAEADYNKPFAVRDYLEREGLMDAKEKKALAEVYGLLSNKGGHPYMAQNDQARLLRHLALTFSQFTMLRFQGSLKAAFP